MAWRTVARLTRIDGVYYMQLGAGRELDARRFLQERLGDKEPGHLGGTWGKVVVDLGVRADRFVKVIGANHLHATLGDVTAEIEAACPSKIQAVAVDLEPVGVAADARGPDQSAVGEGADDPVDRPLDGLAHDRPARPGSVEPVHG